MDRNFKYDRKLLTQFCRCAFESLQLFYRMHHTVKEGTTGAAMVIHTFGSFPEKFHPHVHLMAVGGLFAI